MGVLQEDKLASAPATPAPAAAVSALPPWASAPASAPPPWATQAPTPSSPQSAEPEGHTSAIDLEAMGVLQEDKLAALTSAPAPSAPPPWAAAGPSSAAPASAPAASSGGEPDGANSTQAIDISTLSADGVASQFGLAAPSPVPASPAASNAASAPISGGSALLGGAAPIKTDFSAFPSSGASTAMIDISIMAEPLTASLLVEAGDTNQREYKLGHDRTTMGRGEDCQLVLPGKDLSRMHMVFERKPQGFSVRDLQSSNGTFVNGHRVLYAELRDGDLVEVGRFRLRFKQRGGDPNALWKGSPRVDFHPNDHPNARAYMSAATTNTPATPGDAQSQATITAMPTFTPGARMPDASNPVLSNPRMIATEANMVAFQVQPKRSHTVKIVVLGALFIACVAAGLLIWLFSSIEPTPEVEAAANTTNQAQEQAKTQIDQAQKLYNEGQWEAALVSLDEAIKLDATKKASVGSLRANILNDQSAAANIVALLAVVEDPEAPDLLILGPETLRDLLSIEPQGTYLTDFIRNRHLPKLMSFLVSIQLKEAQSALEAKDSARALAQTKAIQEQLALIRETRADLKAFALSENDQAALAATEKAIQDMPPAATPSPATPPPATPPPATPPPATPPK